jgi:signal transduction histidine kinase
MTLGDPSVVLVISPTERAVERIAEWLADSPAACEVRHAGSIPQARRLTQRFLPAVIFFDATMLSGNGVRSVVRELGRYAPVVAAVSPESARELSVLVVAGTADCVPAGEEFLDLASALIERRLLSARRLAERIEQEGTEEAADFGSLLRHELNNPLTGILGNAEMLLNRRQGLPQEAVPRLETIADLAVRLRETIRRLSSAWETRQPPQHISSGE